MREEERLGDSGSPGRAQQKIDNQSARPRYPDTFLNIVEARRHPERQDVPDDQRLYKWLASVLGLQLLDF
jgi:hypothetical protein